MKPLIANKTPADEGGRTPEDIARQTARLPLPRTSRGFQDEAPHWTVTSGMIDSLCRDHVPFRGVKKQERPCGSSADSIDVVQAFLSGSTAG